MISLDRKTDVSELKSSLLQDNPMLTALFLQGSEWENLCELADWGKKCGLSIGISADRLSPEEIKKAADSGNVDFVRLELGKNTEFRKKAGIVRSLGVRHEFLCKDAKDEAEAEKKYKSVSPCDCFVLEASHNSNSKTRESLMNLAHKYKSIILRFVY